MKVNYRDPKWAEIRMVAWARRYGLTEKPVYCISNVIGKRCIANHNTENAKKHKCTHESYITEGYGHADHSELWLDRKNNAVINTFHQYAKDLFDPARAVISDERGVLRLYRKSWYNPSTIMGVLTAPDNDRIYTYDGEIPNNPLDFWDACREVKHSTVAGFRLTDKDWNDFLQAQTEYATGDKA